MQRESAAALVWRALLLEGDAYLEMRARHQPLRDGARLLVLLGTALGLASASAAMLHWAGSPAVVDVQRVLGRQLAGLPLLRRLQPGVPGLAAPVHSQWLWLAAYWSRPAPLAALLRLVTGPLGLFAGWLGFGLPAHGLALLFGGRGRLVPTLACLALAEAPQALLLVPVLPPLGLAGLGVWAWVLAARFQALRAAHGLDGWRAFWATLLPVLLGGAAAATWLAAALLLGKVVQ